MILTTWFTSLRKTNLKQSNCPYKLEPSCGVLLEKHLDLSEKQLPDGLKPVKNVFGKTTRRILKRPWVTVMLVVLLVSLTACAGKVILLKDGEMRLLEEDIELNRKTKHSIEVVVDRVVVKKEDRMRLADTDGM